MKQMENEMNVNVPLEVIKASEIEPKEVKWLWYPYIPYGKVTLLQGDPGDGKSKLMLSIAALLSKGEPLPFTETEENEPMTIIYQTTEDDADDTVVPRFNSAGGNGENLIFIKEDEKSLSFGDNRIAEAIEKYHAKLLILDPMSSYIGENCSMNNANETRAEFNHLIAVAKNTGCAIVINLLGEKSEELTGNFKRSRNTSLAFERKMTPWTMGLNILYGIGIAAIFGLAIFLEQNGGLSLAYVLGVLLFVFDLFGPLKALYGEASRLTVMNAALDRIEAVLDEPELPDTGKQHLPSQAQPGQPEVQFSDVAFAYQDKEVLHHINFAMKKNSMTALVGPSGGGKSTIANLLARLWDVKSGSVTIRGVDIRNVPLSELMDQISMVFQRVYLFQDTIYNNISMGKPDATEEEVYEAAKKARCYDFIMALPDGFQTVVGEGGATLSGGEKQRISIARCILKDAPIVILDEATASVDTDNESYIQEAISELVKGKTLLVIAHRLNTIQNADQILVIDNGQIAQHGTHEELLEQPGIYQDFVNIRKSAAGWSLA